MSEAKGKKSSDVLQNLGCLAVIGLLSVVTRIPALLGAREKGRTAACDNLYVALNGEIAKELDGGEACGDDPSTERIIECVVDARSEAQKSEKRGPSSLRQLGNDSSHATRHLPGLTQPDPT